MKSQPLLLALISAASLASCSKTTPSGSSLERAGRETIVCSIIKESDSTVKDSVVVDLAKIKESYDSKNGIDVGENNFSFSFQGELDRRQFHMEVFFYENNNVQDEVGSMSAKIDLTKTKPGKPAVVEPLEYDGKKVATFICYHNRPN